jgi:hypothetical protein
MDTCKSLNAAGEPCMAPAGNNGYCFWHDEKAKESCDAARVLGGINRKIAKSDQEYPGDIKESSDIIRWINCALSDVWLFGNSERRSKSIASLLRIALDALEASDTSKRLAQLEELIYANNKKAN